MSNQLTSIDFNSQTILTAQQDGIIYTAIKPICENIGLAWNAQLERINRDEVLNSTVRMIRMVANDGKNREMLCLPIHYLNGWLFGVDVSRVKAEIKDKIITYKKECYQALFDYWNKGIAINPRRVTISIEQQSQIRLAVAKRCKSESIHYATIYEALKKHFDIPRYTELLANDFDECMALIESIELKAPQIAYNQSYLTRQDALTLAKVMDYARLYAEFAPKVGIKGGQVEVATLYNQNSKDDDDGFFVCYRPRYKDDIDKALTLFRNIAQNSLLA